MSKINEIIVLQIPDKGDPCTAYLLDNGDGTHDRYVSDENGNISKQAGGIKTIQAGANITIDNTDPKNPIISSTGGGSSNETDPVFSASPSSTITNSDINNWNSKLSSEIDTLESVVNRGNYSPKYITFTGTTTTPTRDGAIGFNPTTYSYYFGNMNQNHTGYYNIALGYNSMPKLTSNHYNVAVGSYAGSELTTGQSNSFFGSAAGYKLTTGGWNVLLGEIAGQAITTGNYNTIVGGEGLYSNVGYKNTSLGYATGYWDNTGNLGTYIGYKTASGNRFGNNNLMLGNYAGGKNVSVGGVGTMGDNNLFIGTGAGYNDTGLSNKLIIHSNGSLSGFSNTAEGNFTTNAGNFNNALITGDFAVRWLKLNGSLIVNPSYLTADATFTKNVVAKTDGTFGIEDKISVPAPPTTGNYILKSINGVIQWIAE